MKRSEFKSVVSDFLIGMCDAWFEGKPIFKGIAKTVIQSNISKFDGLIEYIEDENGNVNAELLVQNLGSEIEKGMTIDLTTISPFLPQRILIITKEDIYRLIEKIKG